MELNVEREHGDLDAQASERAAQPQRISRTKSRSGPAPEDAQAKPILLRTIAITTAAIWIIAATGQAVTGIAWVYSFLAMAILVIVCLLSLRPIDPLRLAIGGSVTVLTLVAVRIFGGSGITLNMKFGCPSESGGTCDSSLVLSFGGLDIFTIVAVFAIASTAAFIVWLTSKARTLDERENETIEHDKSR